MAVVWPDQAGNWSGRGTEESVQTRKPPGSRCPAVTELGRRPFVRRGCRCARQFRSLPRSRSSPHLLSKSAADESADTVSLPVGGLHDRLERAAALTPEQVQQDCLLASLARAAGLSGIPSSCWPVFPTGFALLVRLARVGLAGADAETSAAGASPWIAFQIRPVAALRLVNRATGFTPGTPFQMRHEAIGGPIGCQLSSSRSDVNI